jgi:hypothetical protein
MQIRQCSEQVGDQNCASTEEIEEFVEKITI